jgi:Alginate lyase
MLQVDVNRRYMLALSASLAVPNTVQASPSLINVRRIDAARSLRNGRTYLAMQPQTVTSFQSPTSPGGLHDYYSQGDYWWPDPANPSGPYIRRDGLSNPNRFEDHRQALIRFCVQMLALVAAYDVRGNRRFSNAAQRHLDAWVVTPGTRMAPHLDHAQAITNLNKGRGVGLIDTLHLVEVARAAYVLDQKGRLGNRTAIHDWFARYIAWMQTSPNGIEERDSVNNHASCYVLQLTAFAQLVGDTATMAWCVERFKTALVPKQIAIDGKLPLELARTKPFGYCLFNLEVMATLAHLLSTPADNLWTFKTASSGSVADAFDFMTPFMADKSKWLFARDVEYWDKWPVRQASLLFAGLALPRPSALDLWARLDPDPTTPEVIRNFPIRQPRLWFT